MEVLSMGKTNIMELIKVPPENQHIEEDLKTLYEEVKEVHKQNGLTVFDPNLVIDCMIAAFNYGKQVK